MSRLNILEKVWRLETLKKFSAATDWYRSTGSILGRITPDLTPRSQIDFTDSMITELSDSAEGSSETWRPCWMFSTMIRRTPSGWAL